HAADIAASGSAKHRGEDLTDDAAADGVDRLALLRSLRAVPAAVPPAAPAINWTIKFIEVSMAFPPDASGALRSPSGLCLHRAPGNQKSITKGPSGRFKGFAGSGSVSRLLSQKTRGAAASLEKRTHLQHR